MEDVKGKIGWMKLEDQVYWPGVILKDENLLDCMKTRMEAKKAEKNCQDAWVLDCFKMEAFGVITDLKKLRHDLNEQCRRDMIQKTLQHIKDKRSKMDLNLEDYKQAVLEAEKMQYELHIAKLKQLLNEPEKNIVNPGPLNEKEKCSTTILAPKSANQDVGVAVMDSETPSCSSAMINNSLSSSEEEKEEDLEEDLGHFAKKKRSQRVSFVIPRKSTSNFRKMYQDNVEVEAILDKKIMNGKVYYLLKWKEDDPSQATWEPIEHLDNCDELLLKFEEKLKSQAKKGKKRR